MPASMATSKGVATSVEGNTKGGDNENNQEDANITTTTQGAPYAIKYERVVDDDDEEYDELEMEEEAEEMASNDGSLFEEDFEDEGRVVGGVSGKLVNEGEVDGSKQKNVMIKLQTINVRGVQNGGLRRAKNEPPEEEVYEQPIHVKREVDSDEEYVYPPKKRSKTATPATSRKKRRVGRGGRLGPSTATVTVEEAKVNLVRRMEEKTKPRRVLLQSGVGGKNFPVSFKNASVQCNIPRLDPIKEGILAEMTLINDLFKLEMQKILNRPRVRRKKQTARVVPAPSSWRQQDRHYASKRVVDTLRVVKKEITEDDTVEIIVCDSSCV